MNDPLQQAQQAAAANGLNPESDYAKQIVIEREAERAARVRQLAFEGAVRLGENGEQPDKTVARAKAFHSFLVG